MNNDNDCRLGQSTNIMPNCQLYRRTFKCILSTSVYVWTCVPLSRHQVYPIWEAQTLEGYLEKVQTEVDLLLRTLFIPLYFVKAEAIILKKSFCLLVVLTIACKCEERVSWWMIMADFRLLNLSAFWLKRNPSHRPSSHISI